jgi:hypothetical protein
VTSLVLHVSVCQWSECIYCVTEKMETLGYNKKEVEESLADNKYNDIMATYLLLSRKATEVSNKL